MPHTQKEMFNFDLAGIAARERTLDREERTPINLSPNDLERRQALDAKRKQQIAVWSEQLGFESTECFRKKMTSYSSFGLLPEFNEICQFTLSKHTDSDSPTFNETEAIVRLWKFSDQKNPSTTEILQKLNTDKWEMARNRITTLSTLLGFSNRNEYISQLSEAFEETMTFQPYALSHHISLSEAQHIFASYHELIDQDVETKQNIFFDLLRKGYNFPNFLSATELFTFSQTFKHDVPKRRRQKTRSEISARARQYLKNSK